MNILIIGAGGREHALAWKATQSPKANRVYVAPGNAGTARELGVENVPIGAEDTPALLDFARKNNIGLTIVGPERPLVQGVVDAFAAAGLRCFGPSRRAAQLEGSKTFAKDFLVRRCIPTAAYASFTDTSKAIAYIQKQGAPLVIKADGLAAGKGVVIAHQVDEATGAVKGMLEDHAFGQAGARVVIEEFLVGEEASFMIMVDGEHCLALASSQDHKARDNGDLGPNTGGMGAYSPAPVVTPELHARILRDIALPTVQGMAAEGHPYTGFLYIGLMIGADSAPKVLEYNCRLGDPETQPILMRLQSDLVELCEAALDGKLETARAEWDSRTALGVVLAAEGYPGPCRKGEMIHGLLNQSRTDMKLFHAGTEEQKGTIVTTGGRVLCACALGQGVREAKDKAYELAEKICWKGMFYRTDIGHRALAREL